MGLKKQRRQVKTELNHCRDTMLSLDHELERLVRMNLQDTVTHEVLTAVKPVLHLRIQDLEEKLVRIKRDERRKKQKKEQKIEPK